MANPLLVTVQLNAGVYSLPYRNPTLKRGKHGYAYWVHMRLKTTLFTLFLESNEDINVGGSRRFDAVAYFMRDDLQLEEEASELLRAAPQPLLNGSRQLGEIALKGDNHT
jgi:hypothetical protein